jgi:hypothetical protein
MCRERSAWRLRSRAGEIFGDAPNIAARVQALAEPGAVLVTARVQRQVAGLFVAEEPDSHQLKGVLEPVTCGGGRRAGQRHLTPLVGRDEEIAPSLCSLLSRHRFPPPWILELHNDACFIVRDKNGQASAISISRRSRGDVPPPTC